MEKILFARHAAQGYDEVKILWHEAQIWAHLRLVYELI